MNEQKDYTEVTAITANPFDDIAGELTSRTQMYSSMSADTPEKRAILFKAMNNPDKHLGDIVGETIYVTDLFCESVMIANKDTGEESPAVRTVLIDKDGLGYASVSKGIFSAVKKLIMLCGQPTWETPIPLKIAQINKDQRRLLTFDILPN